jgi:hypothetical protein
MKRRKWYLRPISRPKLKSSHVILQVSAYMHDIYPHGTPQRWRSYHFFKWFLIYIYIWGGCHPHFCQGGDWVTLNVPFFWYLFKLDGAHHKIYKTTGVYIEKKKLYLSNKHLVIFWVISIGHAYNFVFPIVTCDWLCFFFFFFYIKGSILVNMLFWYTTDIHVTFGSKQVYQI